MSHYSHLPGNVYLHAIGPFRKLGDRLMDRHGNRNWSKFKLNSTEPAEVKQILHQNIHALGRGFDFVQVFKPCRIHGRPVILHKGLGKSFNGSQRGP